MKKTLLYLLLLTSILSCSKDLEGESLFHLYYSDYAMLGASSSAGASSNSPSYKGGAPTEFKIERITLNNEMFVDNELSPIFAINPETGVVTIHKSDTAAMDCGDYSLTISCLADGVRRHFDSAFNVTVYLSLPASIVTSNPEMVVNMDDVAAGDFDVTAEENTSQVESEGGDHITIDRYSLTTSVKGASGEMEEVSAKYFTISSTGLISVNKSLLHSMAIDTYYIGINITTKDGTLRYDGAQSVDVVSAPYSLEYPTSDVNMGIDGGHTSTEPTFDGAAPTEYSILSVMRGAEDVSEQMRDIISINERGVIEVVKEHGFSVDDQFVITIEGRNDYGNDYTTYSIKVINAIVAPSELNYPLSTIVGYTAVAFTTAAPTVNDGYDVVTYSFDATLDESLKGVLAIDENTGVISAEQGHAIECGEGRDDRDYTVKVVATNSKGSTSQELTLKMKINPNYFTYFHYGNNLSLGTTEEEIVEYASQYRHDAIAAFKGDYEVLYSDMPSTMNATWSIEAQLPALSGYMPTMAEDGTFTVSANLVSGPYHTCSFLITAVSDSVPEGYEDTEANRAAFRVSVKTPVFFNFSVVRSGVVVEYTPFAFKVNPKSEGEVNIVPQSVSIRRSVAGEEVSAAENEAFRFDFGGFPYYYNISGAESHSEGEGQYMSGDSFLRRISGGGFVTSGTGVNEASSYYGSTTPLEAKVCYIVGHDHATYPKYSIVVNAAKWQDEAGYANGVFVGRTRFNDMTANEEMSKNYIYPFFIWFDENF